VGEVEGEKKRKIPGHIRSSFWSRLSPKQGRGSDGKLTFWVIQHRKILRSVFKTFGQYSCVRAGWAAREAWSATWNFGTDWEFAEIYKHKHTVFKC